VLPSATATQPPASHGRGDHADQRGGLHAAPPQGDEIDPHPPVVERTHDPDPQEAIEIARPDDARGLRPKGDLRPDGPGLHERPDRAGRPLPPREDHRERQQQSAQDPEGSGTRRRHGRDRRYRPEREGPASGEAGP